MTRTEFLFLRQGDRIYSKSKRAYAVVSKSTGFKTEKDIADAVASVINEEKVIILEIRVLHHFYVGMLPSQALFSNSSESILKVDEEYSHWIKISSILDIDDQGLVNLLLLSEISRIKNALANNNQTVTIPEQPSSLAKISPLYIADSLNLI